MIAVPAEDKLPRDAMVCLTFFRTSDAAALRDVDADPEHRRWFDFPVSFVPSLEHSERVISGWTSAREEGGPFVFAVRAVDGGELLGGCEIRLREDHAANVSYFTLPQHRARGVASRAVALLCQVAVAMLGVRGLEIVVDPENAASRRVAMRNGFQEIGMRDGQIVYIRDVSV